MTWTAQGTIPITTGMANRRGQENGVADGSLVLRSPVLTRRDAEAPGNELQVERRHEFQQRHCEHCKKKHSEKGDKTYINVSLSHPNNTRTS